MGPRWKIIGISILVSISWLTMPPTPALAQNGASREPLITYKTPTDAEQQEALKHLLDEVNKFPDLKDRYIAEWRGDEQSIPLLIYDLRVQFGFPQFPERSGPLAGPSSQFHLMQRLEDITNTNNGLYYPRWLAWWDANRHLSQHEWIRNGFIVAGFDYSEPVDRRFAFELIDVMGKRGDRLFANARRLLSTVPEDQRISWIAEASVSDQRSMRYGALYNLIWPDHDGHQDLLRSLARDADPEIRRTALSWLNNHLEELLVAKPSCARKIREGDKDNRIDKIFFDNGLLIVISEGGDVEALDPHTFVTVWNQLVNPHVGFQVLVQGHVIVLAGWAGDMEALSDQGKILWNKKSDNPNDAVRRLISFRNHILLCSDLTVEELDPLTGSTLASFAAVVSFTDVDTIGSLAFAIDRPGLRELTTGAVPSEQSIYGMSVSATEEMVCMQTTNHLMCFDPQTLALRWSRTIGGTGAWGHTLAPVQGAPLVYATTQSDFTALNVADGSLVWASGPTNRPPIITRFGLLTTANYLYASFARPSDRRTKTDLAPNRHRSEHCRS